MSITHYLQTLIAHEDLTEQESYDLFSLMMQNTLSSAEISAILVALQMKDIAINEIVGAALAMRSFATPLPHNQSEKIVDTCGTGGSGSKKLFNISTASAFILSCADIPVAKHGNRAVSSHSGSADILSLAGVPLALTPEKSANLLKTLGICFLFAPNHHQAMKYVMPTRQLLKIRTIFNILGPLTNPSNTKRQVIGTHNAEIQAKIAQSLSKLNTIHSLVVECNGLDEIGLNSPTQVIEIKEGEIESYQVNPQALGCEHNSHDGLYSTSVESSLKLFKESISNPSSKAAEIVALNAAAAFHISHQSYSWQDGFNLAQDIIASKLALEKFNTFVHYSKLLEET